jgi:Spy/CpxP family protein refolding chaperone
MARHIAVAVAALMLMGGAAVSADLRQQQTENPKQQQPRSQGHESRRGWWHDKRVVTELELTSDQVARLEKVFAKYREHAVPLRKEVEDLEKALDDAIRGQKLDVAAFAQEVDRIENRRAELNKMRAVMLYRLRLVLNADQNKKFQAMLDRRENDRRDNERRKQDDHRH